MEIVIHQLLCGENAKKAWDCLQTTLQDKQLARSIAFKADLTDQSGGIPWQPTVRGFMQDAFFLVMRTFPDESPTVRRGRAFSHVLVLAQSDMARIANLSDLFALLMPEIDKSVALEPIHLHLNPNVNQLTMLPFQDRFNKIIHGYTNAHHHKNTFVWVAIENFEQAVNRFWQILSSDEKVKFNFGLHFNVDAIAIDKMNFVTTPETIESRFMSRGFWVVRKQDTHVLEGVYEQLLAGDSNATRRIEAFQRAMDAPALERNQIETIARVIKTFEEMDTVVDLKQLNTLSNVMAGYSPFSHKGVSVKGQLIEKISKLVKRGDVNAVCIIKNLQIEAFKNHENLLINSIQDWLNAHLFSVGATEKTNFYLLFDKWIQTQTPNWWTKLIQTELKSFLSNLNADKTKILFNWLRFDFKVFKTIQTIIDVSQTAENHFVKQLSLSVDAESWNVLKHFARNRQWYRFHAKLLSLEYPFEKAVSEQLLIEIKPHLSGIELITNDIESSLIIDFTLANGDERLIQIAGKRCRETANLLESIDLKNNRWQSIWLSAVTQGNSLMDGFAEPQQKIHLLFDLMLEGNAVNTQLLERISQSAYANLRNYDKMTSLWSKFPSSIQTHFLKKTAASLLEALSKDANVEVPTDRILEQYIKNQAITDFLYFNNNNIKSVLPIFNKFQLPQDYLNDYVRNHPTKVEAIDAIQIGKLIHIKQYSKVASTIYSKADTSNNWKFALRECYLLLSKWDRLWLFYSGLVDGVEITEDQWWDMATEMIIELYDSGDALKTLWKKAGGKESELLIGATPNSIWRNAVSQLKKGAFADITMQSLLKEIKKDYEKSSKFKIIYDARKNFISKS
jgi:GTPase-associated protein 1, N-terminal domain type 1/Effector-associated domain 1